MVYKIKSEVWLYQGMSAWHFLTVPKKEAEDINKKFGTKKRGWGSYPVIATIGKTKWKTSIFQDKKSGTFLLPLKKEIRKMETIFAGEKVIFTIEIKP